MAERARYTGCRVTDEERDQARLDAEESADIPTRIDAKALVFDPTLLAPPDVTEELRIGVADLDEDLRTMTQNNHEVARWRRLSTRGMERSASTTSDDEPATDEQELPDVTDVHVRPLSRDAYRPPPMRPSADSDTVEQTLEASFSTTSPGTLRSETTPVPAAPNRASRSFGAPREVPRSSDVPSHPSSDDLSISSERTAPFQTLTSELLARVSSAPPPAGHWLPNPAPMSQPASRVPSAPPSSSPSQRASQRPSQRPSARPVFVPKPASVSAEVEVDVVEPRRDLTPTQFVRSPLLRARDLEPERAEVAGIPQSYVVTGLLVFALLIVLSTWWVVH